ncbi:methyltransferase domain-containing protein [Streptomyces sp. NPDC004549]|uniref:class I SAM-dependent methyltransferase n=1 Tax=Streptomyces sp. NPDC004549 TaxID=3154283 RepID=UPI0033A6489C
MTDSATSPGFLAATRAFYDAVAEDYAATFRDSYAGRPLDRALLRAYAELVGPGRPVADLGCGPGEVTALLASLGLDVYGLDLSPAMVEIARREHPGLRFEQGSMLELPLPDGALAGVVSWYSSIHTPLDRLPALFREYRRALTPGGHLLLAFQAGGHPRRHDQPWGHPVALDFLRRDPEHMAALLGDTGFTLTSRTVREPDENLGEPVPQAFLFATAR